MGTTTPSPDACLALSAGLCALFQSISDPLLGASGTVLIHLLFKFPWKRNSGPHEQFFPLLPRRLCNRFPFGRPPQLRNAAPRGLTVDLESGVALGPGVRRPQRATAQHADGRNIRSGTSGRMAARRAPLECIRHLGEKIAMTLPQPSVEPKGCARCHYVRTLDRRTAGVRKRGDELHS